MRVRATERFSIILAVLLSLAFGGCGDDPPADPVSGSIATELLSLSASGAEVGKRGKVRLTFTGPVPADTEVVLSSGAPAIVGVTERALVPKGALTSDIGFDGLLIGQAPLFATVGSVTKSTTATVVDKFKLPNARTGNFMMEVGANTSASFSLNATTPEPLEIPIRVTDAVVVGAPPNVAVPAFSSSGSFPVKALAVGSATFAATFGEQTSESTVTVVERAHLTSQSLASVAEVGSTVSLSASVDAILAKPTPATITSSDPQVAAFPAALTMPAGSTFANVLVPTLAPGQTDVTLKFGESTKSTRLTVVAAAQLSSLNFRQWIPAGVSGELSVSLNAQVAAARRVALSSSDPTVLTVPAEVVVAAGQSSATAFPVALKEGTAVITATYNGLSRQFVSRVGVQPTTLSLSATTTLAVGASTQLYVNVSGGIAGATLVNLTSSDPTVIAVPASVLVNGGESFSLSAQKPGKVTLTASVGGVSQKTDITVLDHASVSTFGPNFNVAVGQTLNGYLYLSAVPAPGAVVSFSSSAPAVLAAPSNVVVNDGSTSVSFPLVGLSPGTALVTATIGASSQTAIVYVGGPSTPFVALSSISSGSSTLAVGASTYGYANFNGTFDKDTPIPITFATPGVVNVPGAVPVLAAGQSTVYFPIQAVGAGTTEVSVVLQGIKRTFNIIVVATPTFTWSVPGTVAAGTTQTINISTNAVLPADVVFTLASSSPSATFSTTTLRLSSGAGGGMTLGLTGVSAGTATLTATAGATTLTSNVTVTP